MSLTTGAVSAVFNSVETHNPVVQVLNVRPVAGSGGTRYRVVLSDGMFYLHGMLATQLNHLVESGQVKELTLLRLKESVTNSVQNKKIAIVLNLDVVGQSNEQIGDPQAIDGEQTQAGGAPQQNSVNGAGAGGMSAGGVQAAASKPSVAAFQPQASSYGGGGGGGGYGGASNLANTAIYPIAQLNPYQNKWTIKARVTQKGDMRTYSNDRGSGKLASVNLLDAQGGEIRATMFNEQVDSFYSMLEKNKVYLISGGTLKYANKRFTSLPHEFEITFNSSTRIEPVVGEAKDIKMQQYKFVPIADIQQKEKNDMVDVIGIVTSCSELGSIVTRKGEALSKRTVTLLDQTARSIELTLWGATAENFDAVGTPVLACKEVRVSDFGGRALSTLAGSALDLNPANVPEVATLRGWVDAQGGVANITVYPLTNGGGFGGGGGGGVGKGSADFKTLADVENEKLGMSGTAIYECEVVVTKLNTDNTWYYDACPQADCKKKVTQDHAGGWRCEKCNQTYQEANPRYVLSVTASDHTGRLWFSLFNDEAEKLVGMSAADAAALQQSDAKAFEAHFLSKTFATVRIKARARSETYQEQSRVKHSVLELACLGEHKSWASEASEIAARIDAMKI